MTAPTALFWLGIVCGFGTFAGFVAAVLLALDKFVMSEAEIEDIAAEMGAGGGPNP